MKKILHVFMILLVLLSSNLVVYEKASAATITGTKGEAVYVAIVTGATAIVTAGLHAHEWYEEKKDEIVEMAYNSWEYMSTDGKEAFLSGVEAYENGWTVSNDLLKNWFDSLTATYPVVAIDGTQRPELDGLIDRVYMAGSNSSATIILKASDYKFVTNGVVSDRFTLSLTNANSQNLRAFKVDEVEITSYKYSWDQGLNIITEVRNAMSERMNPYDVFSGIYQLIGSTSLGLQYKGEMVGQLELDGVDFANNWASNLLNQSEANSTSRPFYVEPTLTLDGVYNPADVVIRDVGGVPTPLVVNPTGDYVDIQTGEVVIPAEVTDPVPPGTVTDGTIGGFFSKLWEWLKAILDAILGLPAAILSGIGALLASLFVPTEDFWQNNFNNLNAEIKRILPIDDYTSILDSLSRLSSPKFSDVVLPSIMGSEPSVIVEADYINGALPTIHDWIRGFMFVLLVLYNVNMIYKLVRGGDAMSASNARAARRGDSE